MPELLIDSEPLGGGRWALALSGHCDGAALRRLLAEARALLLVGARSVSVCIDDLDYLDRAGLAAISDFDRAMSACGTGVEFRLGSDHVADDMVPPASRWFG